jgi:hypothetical protein
MPSCGRVGGKGYVTGGQVVVRMAQAGRHHPDKKLILSGSIEIHLDHLPPVRSFSHDGSFGFHSWLLS